MTMFIQLEDGKPVGHAVVMQNFRALFPDTSFSWPFVPEDIEPLGFGLYDFSNQPDFGTFEKAVEVAPVKDEYGIWRQTWAVEPMTEEEVTARTKQEWNGVRSHRNFRLTMCDWTQLPDAPLTNTQMAAWATYRQALRDVTDQADPFNILWPVSPVGESIPVSAA
jgi:hypothetical protein